LLGHPHRQNQWPKLERCEQLGRQGLVSTISASILRSMKVVEVEATMREKQLATLNNEIMNEVKDWVTDLVYSRTRDTKYFKLAKT
jgi:hypothetical protein